MGFFKDVFPSPTKTSAIRVTGVLLAMIAGAVAMAASPIYIFKEKRMGYHDGYYFPVSVGLPSNPTPTGTYRVKKKVVDYWSRKYDRAMPYSVFFTDAHAIHSGDIYTASKGCIRVPREWAVWLYSKAKTGSTQVIVKP